jgi:hypothetical protein
LSTLSNGSSAVPEAVPPRSSHRWTATDTVLSNYYRGLPSNPQLLASTAHTPSSQLVMKHLYPIPTDHSLSAEWHDEIAPYVIDLIDRLVPPSNACLDAVKIRDEEIIAQPTIWIGVILGIISIEIANKMVEEAKRLVQRSSLLKRPISR